MARDGEPDWAHVNYPKINFQDIIYYSAPKQNADAPKSLDEVDPSFSRPTTRDSAPRGLSSLESLWTRCSMVSP